MCESLTGSHRRQRVVVRVAVLPPLCLGRYGVLTELLVFIDAQKSEFASTPEHNPRTDPVASYEIVYTSTGSRLQPRHPEHARRHKDLCRNGIAECFNQVSIPVA